MAHMEGSSFFMLLLPLEPSRASLLKINLKEYKEKSKIMAGNYTFNVMNEFGYLDLT